VRVRLLTQAVVNERALRAAPGRTHLNACSVAFPATVASPDRLLTSGTGGGGEGEPLRAGCRVGDSSRPLPSPKPGPTVPCVVGLSGGDTVWVGNPGSGPSHARGGTETPCGRCEWYAMAACKPERLGSLRRAPDLPGRSTGMVFARRSAVIVAI